MSRAPTIEVQGFAGKEIRERSGIAPKDIASLMGCSVQYLYRIENGKFPRISVTAFKKWQDALGVVDRRALLANPHAQPSNGEHS